MIIASYFIINIVGVVYFTKLKPQRLKLPSSKKVHIPDMLYAWDMVSVILGFLLFPLFNLSSPISYALYKAEAARLPI